VREIILKQEMARFERVHFKEYGESALNFEVVYFVKSQDYNLYMDIQQAINLEIFCRFQQEGIGFAYPTRTLFVQRERQSA
jgi:small-conductance mechanosensitive channel